MAANVLVVEEAPTLGGSLTSIELVIRHGQAEGMQFGVMSHINWEHILPSHVRKHTLPSLSSARFHTVRQILHTVHIIRKYKYNIVILNNILSANYPALIAARLCGLPVIQFVRAYERDAFSWRQLKSYVHTFIAVSSSVKDKLLELGAEAQSIQLAYEGIQNKERVSKEQKYASRTRWGIPHDAQCIGFVGRLVHWKGFELFTQSAIQSMLTNPNLVAVLVGGGSESEQSTIDALHQQIRTHQLEHRFKWLGHLPPEDVLSVFQGLDLFVHTSIQPEPFGRVLLEAMAMGIPTLSSSEGGPREIITHQQDGLLCSPNDIEELTQTILSFFENEEAERLGYAGQDMVRKRFTEEVCVEPVLYWIRHYTQRPHAFLSSKSS